MIIHCLTSSRVVGDTKRLAGICSLKTFKTTICCQGVSTVQVQELAIMNLKWELMPSPLSIFLAATSNAAWHLRFLDNSSHLILFSTTSGDMVNKLYLISAKIFRSFWESLGTSGQVEKAVEAGFFCRKGVHPPRKMAAKIKKARNFLPLMIKTK